MAWGAAIFLFGASVLLMCDKEAEEVYYKERDVHLAEKSGTNWMNESFYYLVSFYLSSLFCVVWFAFP